MLLLCLFFDCLAMIVVCITKVMNGNRCGQVNVCFLHVLPALLYETCFAINSWHYVWSVIQGLSEKLVVFLSFVSNIMRILDSLNKKKGMSTTRFGFYYILGIFHVEDFRRFHGKLISPFQFIIELEDDVRLLSCAFVHLDSCLVRMYLVLPTTVCAYSYLHTWMGRTLCSLYGISGGAGMLLKGNKKVLQNQYFEGLFYCCRLLFWWSRRDSNPRPTA